jgi:hypothetical protein
VRVDHLAIFWKFGFGKLAFNNVGHQTFGGFSICKNKVMFEMTRMGFVLL